MSEIGISANAQLSDEFATIPDVPIQADSNRVNPNQIPSGVTRGTQKYINTDGSYMTLGVVPDNSGQFGIAFFDSSSFLIRKMLMTTDYIYDKTTTKNIMQTMKLPDGSYGFAVAKTGYNVADAIS